MESLTVCPSKETVVNGYLEKIKHGDKKCKCKYTNNTSEKLIDVIVSYVDGDCAKACREEQKLRNLAKCWTCEKKYSSPILDLKNMIILVLHILHSESHLVRAHNILGILLVG